MRRIIVFVDGGVSNRRGVEIHRDNGPAYMSYNDYCQAWFNNGKLHRLDGPAYICGDYKEWWIDGKQYTKYEHDSAINYLQ